jgi:hypothetical protein
MTGSPMQARAEAASRLPPLATGERDPLTALGNWDFQCYVCQSHPEPGEGGLAYLFGHWMCRDRVACYQRFRFGR